MTVKRNVIAPERRAELSGASVYRITCDLPGCDCDQNNMFCERGFFSLFIQVINGIHFAEKTNLLPWVDFGNRKYCYTDQVNDQENFWNNYFKQKSPGKEDKIVTNKFNEVYPIRIWHRSYYRKMNRVIQNLEFSSKVEEYIQKAAVKIRNQKTLGIHIRGTDHFLEIPPPSAGEYIAAINKYLSSYDKLFVSTDDQEILNLLRDHFGEKVIYRQVERSEDGKALHRQQVNGYKRGLDVLTDCYCLAQCKRLILVSSNVSFASLLFNPEIPYSLIEHPEARWKRYKTLIVYLFDRWGIRKW